MQDLKQPRGEAGAGLNAEGLTEKTTLQMLGMQRNKRIRSEQKWKTWTYVFIRWLSTWFILTCLQQSLELSMRCLTKCSILTTRQATAVLTGKLWMKRSVPFVRPSRDTSMDNCLQNPILLIRTEICEFRTINMNHYRMMCLVVPNLYARNKTVYYVSCRIVYCVESNL